MSRTKIRVPSARLRRKVGNTSDQREYLLVGSRTASTIRNVLSQNGYRFSSFDSILDFACGCGRTLNFLVDCAREGSLFASDHDPELIAWCRRNLQVQASRNQVLPPTEFRAGQFDLIYAISFFTHLPREHQFDWLQEFRRLLRSGGLLLLTTHGEQLALRESVDIPDDGFFYKVGGRRFNQHVAFQTQAFVEREWGRLFSTLDYAEMGLLGHQDIVLLAKGTLPRRPSLGPAVPVPEELLRIHELRPDLKEHFREDGLGRAHSSWRNLTLRDWALSNGGYEVCELAHLSFEAVYEVVEGD